MGIPVNLEESTLVRATIERVRKESAKKASIDNIIKIMRSRFQDDLPPDLRERLEKYSQDELHRIAARSATTASAEQVLTKPPASNFKHSPPLRRGPGRAIAWLLGWLI